MKKTCLWMVFVCLLSLVLAGPAACTLKDGKDLPVVLLTDFGSEDYRVPQLKGIIYHQYPQVRLIDASHDIPAFDIPTGAFILDITAREFSENAVFVGVIDAYEQDPIRYLVMTTGTNQMFVLPDNGLLTYVAKNNRVKNVYQINKQSLFDKPMSELSAERIMGKIGAMLASGHAPREVGTSLPEPRQMDIQEPAWVGEKLLGTVVYIDHFGNCVTNIPDKTALAFGLKAGGNVMVKSPAHQIEARYGNIYSDVPQGQEIVFVINNLGMVQLSINLGNFAAKYAFTAGTKIEIIKQP